MSRLPIAGFVLLVLGALLVSGCSGPAGTPGPTTTTPVTPPPTTLLVTMPPVVSPVVSQTVVPTEAGGTFCTPGILPNIYSIDFQVQNNGESINPRIIVTCRGGNGLNFISGVNIRVTRSDGVVETARMPTPLFVGESVSLGGTTRNNDRTEICVTAPQVETIEVFDEIIPFRTYN